VVPSAEDGIRAEEKWLSNVEIDNYLKYMAKQYEDVFNASFVTIDFNQFCSVDKEVDICHVTLKQLVDQRKHHLVMPMNLDTHDGPGFHWTANYVFLDYENQFRDSFYYYFDSAKTDLTEVDVGKKHANPVDEAPNSVQQLHRRFRKEIQDLGKSSPSFPLVVNRRRHQRGNNNCGVYVIFVLTLLCSPLNKKLFFDLYVDTDKKMNIKPFTSQKAKIEFLDTYEITDGAMNHYRQIFFQSTR
jgi:hypothetical protein